MCIRDRLQVQLLCFVHAGGQSSACHPLQAHLVLETEFSFRLILYWKRLMIDFLQCFDLPLSEGRWSRVMESAIPVTITNLPGETNRAVQNTQAQTVSRRIGGEGRGPPCDRNSSAHADRASQQEAEAQARQTQAHIEQASGGSWGII